MLISVFELLWEPTVSDALSSLVSTVEADDSNKVACNTVRDGFCVVLDVDSGAEVEFNSRFDRSCEADVENGSAVGKVDVGIGMSIGSRFLFSFIETTIFWRSTGVMCFSPLLLLLHESARISSGRAFGIGVAEVSGDGVSSSSSSSDDAESRLDESSGTGMSVAAAFGLPENDIRGEDVDCACAFELQQNVSRFHNRQLKFSSRLPSSIACEVFENSDHCRAVRECLFTFLYAR